MGFLSSFVGGMAGAYNDDRDAEKLDARKRAMAEYETELHARRTKTEMELRDRFQQESEKRAVTQRREEEAYQASPEAIGMRKQRLQGDAESAIGVQTGLIGASANLKKSEYDANKPLADQQAQDTLDREIAKYRTQTVEQTAADIRRMNNPEYLAGKSKEAAATHIDDNARLRGLQVKLAQQALDEKEAEGKIPYAERQIAAGLREQIKSKSAVIDKATAEGTANPEGIGKIQAELSALNKQMSDLYKPYLTHSSGNQKSGPDVKYDSKGNAYIKGPDGNPILKSAVDGATKTQVPIASKTDTTEGQFNAAGYADTQSTIDGAKRGDQKALAMLPALLNDGKTPLSQRRQIEELLRAK